MNKGLHTIVVFQTVRHTHTHTQLSLLPHTYLELKFSIMFNKRMDKNGKACRHVSRACLSPYLFDLQYIKQ